MERARLSLLALIICLSACARPRFESPAVISPGFASGSDLLAAYADNRIRIQNGLVIHLKFSNERSRIPGAEEFLFFVPPKHLRIDVLSPFGTAVASSVLESTGLIQTWLPSENGVWHTNWCEYFRDVIDLCPADFNLTVEDSVLILLGSISEPPSRLEHLNESWVAKSAGSPIRQVSFDKNGFLESTVLEKNGQRVEISYRNYLRKPGTRFFFPSEVTLQSNRANRANRALTSVQGLARITFFSVRDEVLDLSKFKLSIPLDVEKHRGLPWATPVNH